MVEVVLKEQSSWKGREKLFKLCRRLLADELGAQSVQEGEEEVVSERHQHWIASPEMKPGCLQLRGGQRAADKVEGLGQNSQMFL